MNLFRTPRLARSLFGAAALAALAACADEPTGPSLTADAPALASAASSDGKPEFVRNGVRYSDTSKPNATGRAGSASITARALRGQDGKTLLEVTTGALDSDATAPGKLDKVQVKAIVVADEDPMFTKNYNGLRAGGYFSQEYEGVAPGVTLQTQANVSGIDRNRTGVVTLQETVKLRPDLSVAISAPAEARPEVTVHVTGVVSELNGDVGATTECVLYVDGAPTDQAAGVWVDAGGSVTCAFTTSFPAAGTYELSVSAEGVVPGDWDTANNAAAATIEVVEPTVQLRGSASATDFFRDYSWGWTYQYYYPTFTNVYRDVGRRQSYSASGNASGYSFPLDVTLTENSGGTTVFSFSATNVSDYGNGCAYLSDSSVWMYLCPSGNWFQYGRNAGAVTYFSGGYGSWTGSSFAVYAWNGTSANNWGSLVTWADDVNPKLTISSGGSDFVADPIISLAPFSTSYSGTDCYYYYYSDCYAHTETRSGRQGWVTF